MKKAFALALSVLLLFSVLAGCGGGPDNPGPNNPGGKEPALLADGVTYDSNTYLPIVKTPIKLEAMISDNGSQGDYSKRTLWAEMKEKTGIELDIRPMVNYGDGETAALMFASQSYPDISFRLDCKNHQSMIDEAASIGDIIELTDEMMKKYAPNWSKIFKENPDVYQRSVHTDGKLYGLPQIEMQESSINLRDCFFIHAEWLDELGLDKPTTIDEFTAYLRAVKNAAGTGTIPENVEPLYARHWVDLGSAGMTTWWSFLDMYGVYNGFAGEYVVDGKTVTNNYVNPDIKAPIKYVASLYQEGLITDYSLRATYSDYTTAVDEAGVSKTPWNIGSYFGFWNCNHEFLDYLAPLSFENGTTPVVRGVGLDNRLMKDNFFIFISCKYPEAALRLMDTYATKEETLRLSLGEVGYAYEKLSNGTYRLIEDKQTNWDRYGLYNYGPGFTSAKSVQELNQDKYSDGFSREWAYETIYKNYIPADRQLFPEAALSYLTTAEQIEVETLTKRIDQFANNYVGKWVFGKANIDDEWDTYVDKLQNLGLPRLLELKQSAWDAYSKNIQ